MFYVILVLICVIFYILSLFEIKILNKLNSYLMLIILLLFSGLRYGVLWDYFNYEKIYTTVTNWKSILDPKLHIEHGFSFLIVLSHKFGLSWYGFVFFIAFLTLLFTWRFITKYSKNRIASLLLHLSPYFFINDMGAIRNGLSNAIILNTFESIQRKKITVFLGWLILASLFHGSVIAFIIPYLVCNYFRFSAKKIKDISVCLFPLLFLNQVVNISNIAINLVHKLNISIINKYIDRYIGTKFFYNGGISITMLAQIVMLIFVAYTFEKYRNDSDYKQNLNMLNIYFVGILISVIFSNFDMIVARFSLIFLNFDKVLFVNAIYKYKKNKVIFLLALAIYCIARIYIYLRIHPAAHPYKMIFF